MHFTAHIRLVNLLTVKLSSTVMIRDRAHCQLMFWMYTNVLRFELRCGAAHSK